MIVRAIVVLLAIGVADAFAPLQPSTARHVSLITKSNDIMLSPTISSRQLLKASNNGDLEEEEEKKENPYQDPNYPDLEFVNYSDPEYQVDQGVGDEFFDPSQAESDTEEQIEAMREERREKNDEYQFETYYKEILKEGQEYKGEWTVFTTSTFADGIDEKPGAIPKIKKSSKPIKVISRGERIELDSLEPVTFRLQNQRLVHHEKVFTDSEEGEKTAEQLKQEQISMSLKYCPEQLSVGDFRGHQGIMCVGNGYTICTGVKLFDSNDDPAHEGPFAEYRSELGIQFEELRFRVKLDYAVTATEKESMTLPPLRLRSFTVCRETLGMWPRTSANYKSAIQALTDTVFFGPPGAPGGLYDPPPVGSEEQAGQYLLLDLEGGATLLLPFLMDQDPDVHPDSGWVTSLDWTPGKFRYQVDRKVNGGKGILGLRTLELSEVQSADAETYRPRDGGSNMRQ